MPPKEFLLGLALEVFLFLELLFSGSIASLNFVATPATAITGIIPVSDDNTVISFTSCSLSGFCFLLG